MKEMYRKERYKDIIGIYFHFLKEQRQKIDEGRRQKMVNKLQLERRDVEKAMRIVMNNLLKKSMKKYTIEKEKKKRNREEEQEK